MDVVSDASAFLAVALNEAEREGIVNKTVGCGLMAPDVLPYEIGNALIAVKRKGRLNDREILRAFHVSQGIAVRLVPVKIADALRLAIRFNIYAYDAYYLQCCVENHAPLLTLDGGMSDVARRLGIEVVG